MTFAAWCRVVLATPHCDSRVEARSRNLASEDRHKDAEKFRAAVAQAFMNATAADFDAAVEALKVETSQLFDISSAFLGLLPTPSDPHKAWKPVTFVTANYIFSKLEPNFDPDATHLAPQVVLPTPLYAASPRRFIWTSSDDFVGGLTPTDIALSLGLPHFRPDDAVYKIELPHWPDEVFVPTCFDAGLYEAWCIPPRTHADPWGLTRHLLTGDLMHPEILVPLTAVENESLVAHLVTVGGESKVGSYTPDFLRKRTRRGLPK